MCSPALGAAAVGSGVQTAGAYYETKAQNKALEYNARIQEYNAGIAESQAIAIEQRGEREQNALRTRVSQTLGSQKAASAASGVDVNTGSALAARVDTAEQGEVDAMTLRYNTKYEAWEKRSQAQGFRMQAGLDRGLKRNPYATAATTLLTSASSNPTYARAMGA